MLVQVKVADVKGLKKYAKQFSKELDKVLSMMQYEWGIIPSIDIVIEFDQ